MEILQTYFFLALLFPTWRVTTAESCSGLTSYELTFEGLWSNNTFPKQYPKYRPNAQWSKIVGRTHSDQHVMWAVDQPASSAVKEFSEGAVSTGFESEVQGSGGVFDAFMASPIRTGVGQSVVNILANSQYTKLSLIVRLIPSPDWFVGVDRLDLCDQGQWITDKVVNLHPLDAGTDRGFTFTSPNWAEIAPKPISLITSKSPNHPASSFFYPEKKTLPSIARLILKKIDSIWEDTVVNKISESLPELKTSSPLKSKAEISNAHTLSNEKIDPVSKGGKSLLAVPVVPAVPVVIHEPSESRLETAKLLRKEAEKSEEKMVSDRALKSGRIRIKPTKPTKKEPKTTESSRVECELSEWTEWGACSKTCGYGQRTRTRSIIHHPKGNVAPCGLIHEEQLCGTMRGCGWQHFNQRSWVTTTTDIPKSS